MIGATLRDIVLLVHAALIVPFERASFDQYLTRHDDDRFSLVALTKSTEDICTPLF